MRDNDKHTADQWHDHLARLRRILGKFMNNEISAGEKRAAIAAENAEYYGTDFKSPATGELLTKAPRVRNYEPLF